MKCKIICVENFQTVEAVIEVETYDELTDAIRNTRNAIYNATSDIQNIKSSTKAKTSVSVAKKGIKKATDKQKELIKSKADSAVIEKIDFNTLTVEEASKVIDEIFDTK